MADNPTPNFGGQAPVGSPYGQWTPTQPEKRSGSWLAIALAAIAAVVAVAALIVALTRSGTPTSPATSASPTYSAAEMAAAQQQLCDMYQLAAKSVQVDTAGTDKALARIATTNGALMLDMAASNPALDANHRDAARALEAAYLTVTAKSSFGVAADAEFQAALDNVLAKDAVMKKVCGGG
jgi:hypothetical protein